MSTFICPHCGGLIEAVKRGEKTEMKRGFLARLFGPKEFEARQWRPSLTQPIAEPRPFGLPQVPVDQSHILPRYFDLNWKHALASGFFGALALGLLFVPTALGENGKWYNPFVMGGVGFTLASGLVWFILLFFDRKGLAWLEKQTGIDINRDGSLGEAQPKKEPFRFEHSDPQKRTVKFDELPSASEEEMIEVARAILQASCPLSRRELARATSLSEGAADSLLGEMRDKGLARFKPGGPNAGTELAGKGKALLEGLLSS